MEYDVDMLFVEEPARIRDAQAQIQIILDNNEEVEVTYHLGGEEIEDEEGIVVLRGDYGATNLIIREQLANIAHFNPKGFDKERAMEYQTLVIRPV